MVDFPAWAPDSDSHNLALLDLFISSDAIVCSTMAFPPLASCEHVLVSVSIYFRSNSKWDTCFIAQLMTILMLTRMVFLIIWEMFHEKISSNSVVLVLLVNFVSGFRLELMYVSIILNIRSSLTHLHGFQLLCAASIVHRSHFFSFVPTE